MKKAFTLYGTPGHYTSPKTGRGYLITGSGQATVWSEEAKQDLLALGFTTQAPVNDSAEGDTKNPTNDSTEPDTQNPADDPNAPTP